jgi:hypothetical protein
MVEPFCRIEWHGEGRQQIRVFDGAELSADTARDVCVALAEACHDVRTIVVLQTTSKLSLRASGFVRNGWKMVMPTPWTK